jgi:hypothetical protein
MPLQPLMHIARSGDTGNSLPKKSCYSCQTLGFMFVLARNAHFLKKRENMQTRSRIEVSSDFTDCYHRVRDFKLMPARILSERCSMEGKDDRSLVVTSQVSFANAL